MAVRIHAPELRGRGGWINTGDAAPTLASLRGKIVILDFWTFCCINCLHVLDELRALEAEFAEQLVVIGVHSPKFVHEAEHTAVLAAVDRYGVEHPVLDDPDLETWRQYAVRAWPTLVVIDPSGYIVGTYSGEGHLHALQRLLRSLVTDHAAELAAGASPYVAQQRADTTLRFPSKTIIGPAGTLLVASAGNHRLVGFDATGTNVIQRLGSGERGWQDGPAAQARFNEPNGCCLLPPAVASAVGYDVVIADTVNHLLRGWNSATDEVTTIAGTGSQWMQRDPLPTDGPARTPLSSPWDVIWSDTLQRVVIAMAGIHQLWTFDPHTNRVSVLAGTTNEGLVDGPADAAWFAQTSGLAQAADGSIWLADSETSALRVVRFTDNGPSVESAIGTGLFDFGLRDGEATQALLQHPLGLCVLPDGSIAIADTYNGAIRRYDPVTKLVSTLATGLREPADVTVVHNDGEPALLVTESATHGLVRIGLDAAITADEQAFRTQRPRTDIAAGALQLDITFTAPEGQKLDDRYGASTHVIIGATPPELLEHGAYEGPDMHHQLRIADPATTGITEGVLHVAARAASCDIDTEYPACHVHQQDWGVPVRITTDGASSLVLPLAG